MATGNWTVYSDSSAATLAATLETASVVVADNTIIVIRGGTFFAFVVEA